MMQTFAQAIAVKHPISQILKSLLGRPMERRLQPWMSEGLGKMIGDQQLSIQYGYKCVLVDLKLVVDQDTNGWVARAFFRKAQENDPPLLQLGVSSSVEGRRACKS